MDAFIERLLKDTKALKVRYAELTQLIGAPEIIAHGSYWRKLVKEHTSLADSVRALERLEGYVDELKKCDEALPTADYTMNRLILEEKAMLEKQISQAAHELKELLLPESSGHNDVWLEIRADDTRSDSAELCQKLFSMYESYASNKGYLFEGRDVCYAEGGIKSAKALISGKDAYERLKGESGIHVTAGAQKNSVTVNVFSEKPIKVTEIADKDIRIDLFHSGGAGGQNINKVESAVRVTHVATGITVVCQDERSQLKNKERALKQLQERVNAFFSKRQAAENREMRKRSRENMQVVRTYDFALGSATDHRTGLCAELSEILRGNLDELVDAALIKQQSQLPPKN
ncbi:MAG: PCRF domain-containing protein [Clostridia bacterium]|nr:PCRF domain-containing protein [Clostridia bacterium]